MFDHNWHDLAASLLHECARLRHAALHARRRGRMQDAEQLDADAAEVLAEAKGALRHAHE